MPNQMLNPGKTKANPLLCQVPPPIQVSTSSHLALQRGYILLSFLGITGEPSTAKMINYLSTLVLMYTEKRFIKQLGQIRNGRVNAICKILASGWLFSENVRVFFLHWALATILEQQKNFQSIYYCHNNSFQLLHPNNLGVSYGQLFLKYSILQIHWFKTYSYN